MTSTPIRIRRKLNTTADDPAWGTSQIDPGLLRVTLANSETGTYTVTITPENEDEDPIEIDYAGTGGDEPTAAAGIAAALNTAASVAGARLRNYLRPDSSNSSGVLLMAIEPNAPAFTVSFTPPGSATMTPDHTGTLPVVAVGSGKGSLDITMVAVDSSDVPLAPGSGNANVQLLGVLDRRYPQGRKGVELDQPAAVTIIDSATGQALNVPWTVDAPAGRYTVRIDTDASMPVGIAAIEVWVSERETPPAVDVTIENVTV